MPSSLIFAGLVVLWLLILVPAVARHQQEVARPSMAELSGRVLERPHRRRPIEEVDEVHEADELDAAPRGDGSDDDRGWERPPPRYRPGRGGFDPEAAALTARARHVVRQRIVLALLVAAVGTALLAVVGLPGLWWAHLAVDLALVGYLVYLRRQVRLEEGIRERRAARMAGTRRPSAAEDPDLDEWAHRGRAAAGRRVPDPADDDDGAYDDGAYDDGDLVDDELDADDELAVERPERVSGVGEPLRAAPPPPPVEDEPALPRLTPAPPPPLPAGTTVVAGDLDDPDQHDLDTPTRPDYRRAVGE